MTEDTEKKQSKFKHLVISGGANGGFAYLGCLRVLQDNQVFSMDNIETIYSTSIGTYIAILITLGYDYDTLYDFIINRPWGNIYKVSFETVVNSIHNGGIFNKSAIVNTFKPLFEAKELDINMTLQEYFDYCHIEIHYFITNLNKYEIEDFSHVTHPDWKLMDVIYASSCLPLLFPPLNVNGVLYFDGASLLNYPIQRCVDKGYNKDEILGICKSRRNDDTTITTFMNPDEKFKLVNYLFFLLKRVWCKTKEEQHKTGVPAQIYIDFEGGFYDIVRLLDSEEERERLIRLGETYAHKYMEQNGLNLETKD